MGARLNDRCSDSALNTPALFYTDRFVPTYSLIQFLVAAALFYLAVFVLFKRRPKIGLSTSVPRAAREEVVGEENEVEFREECEYPDGSRAVVETALSMR